MRQQQTKALPQPDHRKAGGEEESAHEKNRMIAGPSGRGAGRAARVRRAPPGLMAGKAMSGKIQGLKIGGIQRGRKGHRGFLHP